MRSIFRKTTIAIAATAAAGVLLAGCSEIPDFGLADYLAADSTERDPVADPQLVSAISTTPTMTSEEVAHYVSLLDSIPVKGHAPKTGYSRDQFGPAWTDKVDVEFGRNGCRTRDDVLARDLTNVVFKADGKNCTVLSGILNDPYTGKAINFQRGTDTSSAVQVDHVVALGNSWVTGAQNLTEQQRTNLANDPRNLLAVDGPANGQKSDSNSASWLPSNKGFRCRYVSMQVDVKAAYGLWVTAPERDAIAGVLAGCSTGSADAGTGSLGSTG